jgi:hypothetical protein
MRHLNGVYTQRYNRRHQCDGQLFRGRYQSILIDSDSYLLQTARYIHRHPLCAGWVKRIDSYQRNLFAIFKSTTTARLASVIERMKKKLAGDHNMRIRLYKLEALIMKSQERT